MRSVRTPISALSGGAITAKNPGAITPQSDTSQVALFSGFLPAFLLAGFLFEIDSMPAPVRALTAVIPAKYFVSSLQTVFLAGDVPELLLPNGLAMLAIGAVFFTLVRLKTRKSLEP